MHYGTCSQLVISSLGPICQYVGTCLVSIFLPLSHKKNMNVKFENEYAALKIQFLIAYQA